MSYWKWIAVLVIVGSLAPTSLMAKSKGTLGAISDGLAIGVPLTALGLSLYNEEIEDTGKFVLTFAAQELFVEGAKELMSETSIGRRPSDDGKDKSKGFISSHVSATTAGAIKLWEMYPDNLFVKGFSILSVAVVGYQRVEGDHHNPLQVGLGVGTAFLFDWMGDEVSRWLRDDGKQYAHLSQDQTENLSFSLKMISEGTGVMGIISYTF